MKKAIEEIYDVTISMPMFILLLVVLAVGSVVLAINFLRRKIWNSF